MQDNQTPSTTDGEERWNSLDDKLTSLAHSLNARITYEGLNAYLRDIKQVFSDEGYEHYQTHFAQLHQHLKEMEDFMRDKTMTGQEFYQRFQSEIEKMNVTTDFVAEMGAYKELGLKAHETAIIYTVTKLDQAAKRAAGITNEPEAS